MPAAAGSLGLASLPSIPQSSQSTASDPAPKISADLIARLKKLQEEFATMQQQAYKIGSECQSNDDLAKHPDVYPYVQTLREMKNKIEMTEKDLEKEHRRIAGRPFSEPQKKKKRKGE